jgi:hypothetical protein
MNVKRSYKAILVALSVMTVVSSATVVGLALQKNKKQVTINKLKEKVNRLTSDLSKVEKYKNNVEFYHFKDTVFDLKYRRFADVAEIVYKKSKEYDFNPYIIMALIQIESNFNPYAVSRHGAYGLMQVRYSIWKNTLNIDFSRIFEKEYNIDLGLKVLSHYYKKSSGNMAVALQYYNGSLDDLNFFFNGKVINSRFYNAPRKREIASSEIKGDS